MTQPTQRSFPAFAPGQERQAAHRLGAQILHANWLSKNALNCNSRTSAYRVKAAKVAHGLVQFGRWFRVLSYELHPRLGLLLVVRLPNGSRVHIPYEHLNEAARATLNLAFVPSHRTLPLAE
jgi:hypothetical protein